jgi:hypothetical protein
MTTSPGKLLIVLSFLFLNTFYVAQTASATGSAVSDDEFELKKAETKYTEVIKTDSLPASELLKRAVSWIKQENGKYKKTGGTTTSNKAECVASFPVKPKELNPKVDYTGKISMKVVIECKDNRFRYVVSDIRHISKSGRASAGSVDNKVPDCGSMVMEEVVWKKLKGEALRSAGLVVSDLKEGMSIAPTEAEGEDW